MKELNAVLKSIVDLLSFIALVTLLWMFGAFLTQSSLQTSAIHDLQFQVQNLNVNVWNNPQGITYTAKPENF